MMGGQLPSHTSLPEEVVAVLGMILVASSVQMLRIGAVSASVLEVPSALAEKRDANAVVGPGQPKSELVVVCRTAVYTDPQILLAVLRFEELMYLRPGLTNVAPSVSVAPSWMHLRGCLVVSLFGQQAPAKAAMQPVHSYDHGLEKTWSEGLQKPCQGLPGYALMHSGSRPKPALYVAELAAVDSMSV